MSNRYFNKDTNPNRNEKPDMVARERHGRGKQPGGSRGVPEPVGRYGRPAKNDVPCPPRVRA